MCICVVLYYFAELAAGAVTSNSIVGSFCGYHYVLLSKFKVWEFAWDYSLASQTICMYAHDAEREALSARK